MRYSSSAPYSHECIAAIGNLVPLLMHVAIKEAIGFDWEPARTHPHQIPPPAEAQPTAGIPVCQAAWVVAGTLI